MTAKKKRKLQHAAAAAPRPLDFILLSYLIQSLLTKGKTDRQNVMMMVDFTH